MTTTTRPVRKKSKPSTTDAPSPLRMKDLASLTGLPRQAIHFYINAGLLPAGAKTGRNMAYYTQEHVERLKLIRKLQHERFLPLKAIKALLEGREEQFPREQRTFLKAVSSELAGTLAPRDAGSRATVDAEELLRAHGVDEEDLHRLMALGMVATTTKNGRLHLAEDDAWLIENMGRMRAAGFTRELGFAADDFQLYTDAVDQVFNQHAELMSSRLSHLPPVQVARMIERGLPLIHQLIVRYHAGRVREFFAPMA